ncbi:MAG: hypothetical protein KDC98_19985 [Planctomycetes bacterium]|nr:hypothetical protein [Planctomycetota bacterium]
MPRQLICLAAAALCACADIDPVLLQHHVIGARADGTAIDVLGSREPLVDAKGSFHELMTQADLVCDAAAAEMAPADVTKPKRKLLIHVHGGLNSHDTALESATKATRKMQKEKVWADWHYPIFLVWPSGLFSSYWQSIWTHRRGEEWTLLGPITMPFVFVADVLTAVARAPKNLVYMLALDAGTALETVDWNSFPTWRHARRIAENAAANGFSLQLGEQRHSGWYYTGIGTAYVLTLPTKLVSELVIDTIGTHGWELMLHRCYNVFRRPSEFETGNDTTLEDRPSGAFGQFFAELDQHIREQRELGHEYEVTLVGHSMGAIVLNEALRSFPDLPVDHIVYMAAACTVQDAQDAVVPVVLDRKAAGKPCTFHMLTLHPLADAGEAQWFVADVPARGSLLEWIDNWFGNPASSSQRVLGKWVNAVRGLHLFAAIRDHMTLRGFGYDGVPPQAHGEFNDCEFWRHSFWWPEATTPTATGR